MIQGISPITQQRRVLKELLETGLQSVLPSTILKKNVSYNKRTKTLHIFQDHYHRKGRLFVIGGGKASGLMAETLEEIIPPEEITAGIISCKDQNYQTKKIKIIQAGHPTPNEEGLKATEAMLALKHHYHLNENDLILCLLSGGGSALLPSTQEGITLKDKQQLTTLLLEAGATIHEINTIRKHLSKIKGGHLANYFYPTQIISLILSDVIGNDLSVIASGPTAPDKTTFADALAVLEKYKIKEKAPQAVVRFLQEGEEGKHKETPKALTNVKNYILGDNRIALEAMQAKAKARGKKALLLTTTLQGDPEKKAKEYFQEIIAGTYNAYDIILLGGETTPHLPKNHGKGGRNQHYVAVTLGEMLIHKKILTMASLGTDGSDYLPDVAGAFVDEQIINKVKEKKIPYHEHLLKYDSYGLFRALGEGLIKTGPTGTNVGDVIVYILH